MCDHHTNAPFVEIGILGPLVVVVGGTPRAVSRGATSVLLELLALDPEPISSPVIASTVEASTGRPCTRATVHTSIWRLRRALGSERSITSDELGYRLNTELCAVDATRFEAAVIDAQHLAREGEHAAAAREFARAVSLWRGPVDPTLSGEPRLAGRILRLEDLRATAMEGWTDALRLAGQPDDAARILERLVVEHPLREHAWTALLQSYADAGRTAEARSAFDRARLHLAEHGLEPGAELHAALAALPDGAMRTGGTGNGRVTIGWPESAVDAVRALDDLILHLTDAFDALLRGVLGWQGDRRPAHDDSNDLLHQAVVRVNAARAEYLSRTNDALPRGRRR